MDITCEGCAETVRTVTRCEWTYTGDSETVSGRVCRDCVDTLQAYQSAGELVLTVTKVTY